MSNASNDKNFAGSIPAIYQTHLVPLLFEPYAQDMANRLRSIAPARVLEIAAGTGVVTRRMAEALPKDASIVATDLNQAMLDQANVQAILRPVEWKQADAMKLPFPDASFDAVVCAFGVMFFPDRPKAYAEARRVLKPGGVFLFNVWDSVEGNEIADIVVKTIEELYPNDPPGFLKRTPYGYFDRAAIERDLAKAGFDGKVFFDTVAARSKAASAQSAAIGYVQGTPMRAEVEARDPQGLGEATAAVAQALAKRLGSGAVDAKMQAHVVSAKA